MVPVAFRNVMTTAGSFMFLLLPIKSVWLYEFLNVYLKKKINPTKTFHS